MSWYYYNVSLNQPGKWQYEIILAEAFIKLVTPEV